MSFTYLYPWSPPLRPPTVPEVDKVAIEPYDPAPRSILDNLFAGWRPELETSLNQSLYLYVGLTMRF